jgi:hypothetical protein
MFNRLVSAKSNVSMFEISCCDLLFTAYGVRGKSGIAGYGWVSPEGGICGCHGDTEKQRFAEFRHQGTKLRKVEVATG